MVSTPGCTTLASPSPPPPLTTQRPAPILPSPASQPPSRRRAAAGLWWLWLAALWGVATAGDRYWLALDLRLPSWDQADYLNSAQDHGRALGLLAGGGWTGWAGLLDLSPKIPPLASLVNGTVMAVGGDAPDGASWALALWHGLLLVVVACWGRQLVNRWFGLLAAALVALTPALAALRVDYTLDMAVAATCSLALWRLGAWQAPSPRGGGWSQALGAALAVGAALLVKQSSLLMVALPVLWAAVQGLGQAKRRPQVLTALLIVVAMLLPWLRHNWITTIGGTNRAVLESGAAEGDPNPFSLASFLWYPRLWPRQLGAVLPPALAAVLVAAWRRRRALPACVRHPVRHLPPGWGWLIGCAFFGWLLTTLSPNKDARYIAPVLPLLVLVLTMGWWRICLWLRSRLGQAAAIAALGAALMTGTGSLIGVRSEALERQPPAPVRQAIAGLRKQVGDAPTTLVMVPGSPDLNEQTVTTFGLLDGGRIVARRLGRRPTEHPLVLERSEWILLATGDQGTDRPFSRQLSHRVRADGRFELVDSWPWNRGRRVELWRREPAGAKAVEPFDQRFIGLARGMEQGPPGLNRVFDSIGAEHQIDGHFLYQGRVRAWALDRLERQPDDRDALWSLALLATLRNRPAEAQGWFARLQALEPDNPWPVAYRATVQLAAWKPWQANRTIAEAPLPVRQEAVVRGLGDLSRLLSGHPLAIGSLRKSLPAAIDEVKASLEKQS